MRLITCQVCKKYVEVETRHDRVCPECFPTTCPECGYHAYWLTSKSQPLGKYICMSLDCPWASYYAPTEEMKYLSRVHSWKFCKHCGLLKTRPKQQTQCLHHEGP